MWSSIIFLIRQASTRGKPPRRSRQGEELPTWQMFAAPDDTAALGGVAVRTFGSLEILVNNAGIIRDVTVKRMSADSWQDVIDTNLSGVFRMCKSAAVEMSDGGRIVNLSSISALIGFFGQANYSASKAGVIALTKVLSRELAKRQITVNAIAPGVVLTEMGRSIPHRPENRCLLKFRWDVLAKRTTSPMPSCFCAAPWPATSRGKHCMSTIGWVG
ncbi:MAG: SDR family NAD(P)-dependent oxidoreductase [Pirellulaceae bacterium]